MEDVAQVAIDRCLKLGAEFADVRLESVSGANIVVMDGKTKTVTSRIESGCGVRAFMGGGWGFAVCNSLDRDKVSETSETAVKLAKVSREKAKVRFEMNPARTLRTKSEYACEEMPASVPLPEKLSFAIGVDESMRSHDSRITSRNTRYEDFEGDRVVANSFGSLVTTKEVWSIISAAAWSKSDGIVQRGHGSVGNVGGYEIMRSEAAAVVGKKAAEQAIRLLDSKPAPAGKFTCILDNQMTGLLAHEAFGHACEADAILAGASVLEGMDDKKVADEGVTLVDDQTIPNTFGYFPSDWEGVEAEKHVLIERGMLRGFMHNIETSSRMGKAPNGAARAESYCSPPIIRMSNTYIEAGDAKKDELIEDTRSGLLIRGGQYGYVEPAKGQFMFKCDEAYDIRNGEIGQRYRDTILTGIILEVLNHISGIGDDFKLVDPGYCGKSGQEARTTDGGPHLRVDDIVIGGLA